ncbi:uncharacterized protein LOC121384723 [Gigantopelta aegis]|uniref:uncharacterized protein LOC121384723 n=1 Tax=Gigantopelta aegis TaxID=1735272 RepID=UPI001B88959A|nr:uncharacterized protein LOC121384723 [Gigantopelta aegis]
MLRTCTPGGLHAPPISTSRADPTNSIRRQIVDMVRISEHKGQTVIYDLHQHHGVKVHPLTELDPNRLENIGRSDAWQSDIRKLHTRGRQSRCQYAPDQQRGGRNYGKENNDLASSVPPALPPRNSSSFPSSVKQSKDSSKMKEVFQSSQSRLPTQMNQTNQDSFKRIRSGIPNQRQEPRPKSIRQKTEDLNSHYQSTSSSSPSDKGGSKGSGQPCLVRGSAISNHRANARAVSPIKREEVKKRANRFSASLDFFRRRLKMNQSKFLNPENKVTHDDYVIRKEDGRNGSCKQKIDLRFVPRPPTTSKNANGKSSSGNDSNETKETRFSYRLPEVENEEEVQVMTLGEIRTLPQVGTYVLEDDDEPLVVTNQEPAPLTAHNVEIHNMLMDARAKKHKVVQNGVSYDGRLLRWLEDLNTQKAQKMVTFDMSLPAMERVDTSSSSNGLVFSKRQNHKWNDVI